MKTLTKLRPGHIVPELPRNTEPRTGLSMGEHAAIMAKDWGIGREEQDELAVASHRNLAAAYDTGFLDDLVMPFLGLERDQNLRPDSSVEKLAKLKPVFDPDGTTTAGNAPGVNDGAGALVVTSEEFAKKRGLDVLATIVAQGYVADEFAYLARTPAKAGAIALEKAGKKA